MHIRRGDKRSIAADRLSNECYLEVLQGARGDVHVYSDASHVSEFGPLSQLPGITWHLKDDVGGSVLEAHQAMVEAEVFVGSPVSFLSWSVQVSPVQLALATRRWNRRCVVRSWAHTRSPVPPSSLATADIGGVKLLRQFDGPSLDPRSCLPLARLRPMNPSSGTGRLRGAPAG